MSFSIHLTGRAHDRDHEAEIVAKLQAFWDDLTQHGEQVHSHVGTSNWGGGTVEQVVANTQHPDNAAAPPVAALPGLDAPPPGGELPPPAP